jgi:hypothetical protein
MFVAVDNLSFGLDCEARFWCHVTERHEENDWSLAA